MTQGVTSENNETFPSLCKVFSSILYLRYPHLAKSAFKVLVLCHMDCLLCFVWSLFSFKFSNNQSVQLRIGFNQFVLKAVSYQENYIVWSYLAHECTSENLFFHIFLFFSLLFFGHPLLDVPGLWWCPGSRRTVENVSCIKKINN